MNKPTGFTSFDVIAKLRGILKYRRLGHTGTLDPMAEGVLPVLVGSATKACSILPDETKTYRAGFQLGCITDTQDSTGTILKRLPVDVTTESIAAELPRFTGELMQVPPMYSAVQINGKRLYDLARAGKVIDRPARPITVYKLTLCAYDAATMSGLLEVTCGKGTYVRTLLHDLGSVLGCGACMTTLVRTAACGLTLAEAHSFAEVEDAVKNGTVAQLLCPTARLFADLPRLVLTDPQTAQYRNGVKLPLSQLSGVTDAERYAVYRTDGGFLGLANASAETGLLRKFKSFEDG